MTPAKLKFTIYQGATFKKRLTRKAYPYPTRTVGDRVVRADNGLTANPADAVPIDLTGCLARMQVRDETDSPVVLVSLTTENGGITLGGTSGTIDLYLPDEATTAFAWTGGVWDLEIEDSTGEVIRLAQGSISVSPEVTRV